jgi:hypothetical protein
MKIQSSLLPSIRMFKWFLLYGSTGLLRNVTMFFCWIYILGFVHVLFFERCFFCTYANVFLIAK